MKFISRLLAERAIRIGNGSARCVKGAILRHSLDDISLVASEAGLTEGEIWISRMGKVTFSREIPVAMHQRIRNVLSSP